MWIKKYSHRKSSFLLIGFITLILAVVSVTFGTINLSASSDSEVENGQIPSLNHTQVQQFAKNKQFAFPLSILNNIGADSDSVFIVNHSGDTNDATVGDGICQDAAGNCTLRAALQEANALPGVDEIQFYQAEPDDQVLIQLSSTLNPKQLDITQAVKITGLGSDLLTIRGNSNTVSIFNITATTQPTIITGVSLQNSGGLAINNSGNLKVSDSVIRLNATGISNSGTLEVNRVTINNNTNSALKFSGASTASILTSAITGNSTTSNNSGAALHIGGTSNVNILNSQIDNNAATKTNSTGGLYIEGTATVNIANTTITDNTTPGSGGGIYTLSPNLTLNNVTISHNTAPVSGTGIYYGGAASGVYVRNTLIGKNKPDNFPDVFSANGAATPNPAKFISRGNNLIEKNLIDIGFVNGQNGDKVGTVAVPLDPKLGLLLNNGGGIMTRALLDQSPARDAGNSCVTNSSCGMNNPSVSLTTDQRGTEFPRSYAADPTGPSIVDIGAFEAFYPLAMINSFVPHNWGAGAGTFELNIRGKHFVADSVVRLNGQLRVTTFVSNNLIKVQVLASDVQTAGQLQFTVTNPRPGGGTSAIASFSVINCSYALNPTSLNFNPSGGPGSTNVATVNGCQWNAVSNDSWIQITSNTVGRGPGSVTFTVAPNSGQPRTGTLTIAGQTFTVNQGGSCSFTLSPATATPAAAGGPGSFNLTASNNTCGWEAVSDVPWITVSNQSGSGSAQINYNVSANTGPQRVGKITVGGQMHTVTQASGCNITLNPTSYEAPNTLSTSAFGVSTVNGCQWSAVSNVPWIEIISGTSGSGNGTVSFRVLANSGSARQGLITVGNRTFTVNQAPVCTYSINPTLASFPNSGGTSGPIQVTTNDPGCTWTVNNVPNWITVNGLSSGTGGTGSATLTLTASSNTGPARDATFTIAGQTFTVTQLNGCLYSIMPEEVNVSSGGTTGSFSVRTGPGCQWTAASNNQAWLTVPGGTVSGMGDGTVNYSVAANNGPSRNGTITVQNPYSLPSRQFTVIQADGCTYNVNPASRDFQSAGGTGDFVVTPSNTGCTWTATAGNQANWITITGSTSQGTGQGTVQYTVAANATPYREGIITISGPNQATVTHTVKQANGCQYTISPTSLIINESGGTRSFTVTSGATCPWTAQPNANAPWLTISSPANGIGSGIGTVNFNVAPSNGIEREGTITVQGNTAQVQTFTVTQFSLRVSNLNDSGVGSLRRAVINANNMPGNDIITFNTDLEGILTLTTGEIKVENNGSLEIRGTGANKIKVSGNNNSRIFFSDQANLTVSDLTLSFGNGSGEESVPFYKFGGAIYVKGGVFKLERAAIENNEITLAPGPIQLSLGGGIYFDGGGPHIIQNSTLHYNRSLYGGSFYNAGGTVSVLNSTIAENVASTRGGGIYNRGQTTLRNVTLYKNTAPADSGAGVFVDIGIFNTGNTIIAGNNGPEITKLAGDFVSAGNNLVGANPGDSANTLNPVIYQGSDLRDMSPKLAELDYYGGKTLTHALYPDSPARNMGNSSLAGSIDQRGAPRVVESVPDIGAYELNIEVAPINGVFPNPNAPLLEIYQTAVTTRRLDSSNNEFLFSIAGELPPGINMNQFTGGFLGTPQLSGAYNFIVRAKGADEMIGVNRFTINVTCTGTISPSSQSVPASGGTIPVTVTSSNGCNWTATPNQNWISVASGSPGSGNGTVVLSVQPNSGAPREGTVNIAGNTFTINQSGTQSCSYSLNPTNATIPATGGSGIINMTAGSGCSWNVERSATWVTVSGGGSGNGTINYSVAANTGASRNATITAGGKVFEITQNAAPTTAIRTAFDYDGDGKADTSVYRPSAGGWYVLNSANGSFYGVGFGVSTDQIIPADYDGDGKTDVAVYRPSNGGWYWLNSSNNTLSSYLFGINTDIPAPGDFDGDGKSDVSVYRPSNGTWYRLNSGSNNSLSVVQFGSAEDRPVVGDFDGDGKADIAVYRPSNGGWYRLNSSNNEFFGVGFGISEDKPVPADYDGDGKADIAVYRPSNGGWYRLNSTNGQLFSAAFGIAEDRPAPADFDGDGKADITVFRPSAGTWYRLLSQSGQFQAQGFGIAEDIPTPNAFVR